MALPGGGISITSVRLGSADAASSEAARGQLDKNTTMIMTTCGRAKPAQPFGDLACTFISLAPCASWMGDRAADLARGEECPESQQCEHDKDNSFPPLH